MEVRTCFLILMISFSSILSTALSSKAHQINVTWWCAKTPHPEPCTYFMGQDGRRFAPHHLHQFRQMAVQVAVERALAARAQIKQFGKDCEDGSRKRAWSNCLELYDNAILQLNRTLHVLSQPTQTAWRFADLDCQTWLSSALTNIQTCQSGSMDLNVSDYFMPILSNNLTQLVSNSLAINSYFLHQKRLHDHTTTEYGTGNHSVHWLSRHDRRLLSPSASPKSMANAVVAQDGSGNFRTVQAAIDSASRRKGSARFIIYVKKGVYAENIEVAPNNNNVMLVGDGMTSTIITGSRSVQGGYTTYNSATAGIDGQGFIARDITFRNTAGPAKGQAVALRSASDLSIFYRCAIQGYQDTLFVHSQRQFYRECYVYGTVDFIFGNAAVVLQNCFIYVRRPLRGQANIVTAQGRSDPFQNTGIVIQNSRILAANDLRPVVPAFSTYLGRPWQQYSRTVILNSFMDNLISPQGWSPWGNSNFALNTLYYGEYKNYGPGSNQRWRVQWDGFHSISSPVVASRFTVNSLLTGGSWLPATGVPFNLGL